MGTKSLEKIPYTEFSDTYTNDKNLVHKEMKRSLLYCQSTVMNQDMNKRQNK